MATIYLYKFNNYYNRQVKKHDTIEEYGNYAYVETGNNVNFNPSDGVNTSHIFGRQNNPYNGDCDYLIYCQDNINITSRWFIVEQNRTRVGQYGLALRRDVIVDNYDDIVSAPCFIEKATLKEDDVLIYNKEGIDVNQIKMDELPLKDETDCAWICGYIPRSYEGGTLNFSADNVADIEVANLSNWTYYSSIGQPTYKLNSRELVFTAGSINSSYLYSYADYYVSSASGDWNYRNNTYNASTSPSGMAVYGTATDFQDIKNRLNVRYPGSYNLWGYMTPYLSGSYNSTTYAALQGLQGKVLKVGDNTYYKIVITSDNTTVNDAVTEDKSGNPLWTNWKNLIEGYGFQSYIGGEFKGRILSKVSRVLMTLQPLPQGEYKIVMPGVTGRYHLKDAPYDMFCIPYAVEKEEVKVKSTGDSSFAALTISSSQAMNIAQGIAEAIGKDNIYDLQLLPFCPMTGFDLSEAKSENLIDIKATDSKRYTIVTNTAATPANKAVILWSLASQGTFDINHEIEVGNKKIENQTDKYRIVSPNYNGVFEFSAAYNDGVDRFNVDYTYLPYNSYIHVNPNFKNLYGNDYNDARGLICQGDFSISYLSDAWVNYQVQNKNYLNIFNRGIENMETNNKIANIQRGAGIAAGAIQGAAAGALVGGPIGAAVGGVLSAGAGAVDMHYAKELQAEALDYSRDLFDYNLQNIRALPDSIARTTAYTANNKVFPVLEYYTCKEREKMALANKIAWNGMTVMAIGTIQEYIGNEWEYEGIKDKGYIKGQLIRIENLHDDTHMLNAITDEIYRGGYFK